MSEARRIFWKKFPFIPGRVFCADREGNIFGIFSEYFGGLLLLHAFFFQYLLFPIGHFVGGLGRYLASVFNRPLKKGLFNGLCAAQGYAANFNWLKLKESEMFFRFRVEKMPWTAFFNGLLSSVARARADVSGGMAEWG